MLKIIKLSLFTLLFCTTSLSFADITVQMFNISDKGTENSAGNIIISKTKYGLLFTPDLHGLTPGIHGFHIHQNPDCGDKGMAAGGHFDPKKTKKHLGPYNNKGHLGDLPALYVDSNGSATIPVLAPRLDNLKGVENHALMVHEGGDNYSDEPVKLGGGNARMVCGVIK